jgi:VanZ family protein
LIPGPRVETGFVPADKMAHLVAFGGMQWLFLRALSFFRARGRFQIAGTVGCAALAGLLLELAQALVPYRSADVWDFVVLIELKLSLRALHPQASGAIS